MCLLSSLRSPCNSLQRKRSAEYFSELLNPKRPAIDLSGLDDEEDLEYLPFLADKDDPHQCMRLVKA